MPDAHEERLSIDWGEDTCDVCDDSTWLALVLYEPIDAQIEEHEDGRAYISAHPAPQEDHPIAICNACLGNAKQALADHNDIDTTDVVHNELSKYLIYLKYPEYVEKLYPEDAERFAALSSD